MLDARRSLLIDRINTLRAFAFLLACGVLATGCGSSSPSKSSAGAPSPGAMDAGQTNSRLPSFAQSIQSDVKKLSLSVGEKITIPVTLRNTGQEAWSSIGKAPITFSYRWLLDSQDKVLYTARTLLPQPLPSGNSVALTATVIGPPVPGDYTLRLSMVQEGIAWFFNEGGQPLDIPVKVH
jgi:hypothetical protein